VLICYRTRRRIGAYLDEALGDREAARAAAHIAACARCHAEVESLRRLSVMLRHSVPSPAPPEWTGFWEGVRRGIEAPRVEARALPRWRPRLVVGAAGALAVAASLMILSQVPWPSLTPRVASVISVSSADTDHPGGTVMVYSPPDQNFAVVWVFPESTD
jgi:anti-sigma factor RsiW